MRAIKPVAPIHGRMVEQIPVFAAIGVIGYFVDSGITLSAPNMSACRLLRAFPQYCGVASVGFAINYAVYSTCVIRLPAWGSPSGPRSFRCSSPPAAVWRWF